MQANHVICRNCSVPHVENCRMCFGWGLLENQTPITATISETLSSDALKRCITCPECGGTLTNDHLKAEKVQ